MNTLRNTIHKILTSSWCLCILQYLICWSQLVMRLLKPLVDRKLRTSQESPLSEEVCLLTHLIWMILTQKSPNLASAHPLCLNICQTVLISLLQMASLLTLRTKRTASPTTRNERIARRRFRKPRRMPARQQLRRLAPGETPQLPTAKSVEALTGLRTALSPGHSSQPLQQLLGIQRTLQEPSWHWITISRSAVHWVQTLTLHLQLQRDNRRGQWTTYQTLWESLPCSFRDRHRLFQREDTLAHSLHQSPRLGSSWQKERRREGILWI